VKESGDSSSASGGNDVFRCPYVGILKCVVASLADDPNEVNDRICPSDSLQRWAVEDVARHNFRARPPGQLRNGLASWVACEDGGTVSRKGKLSD
jgi:hypothetical protein